MENQMIKKVHPNQHRFFNTIEIIKILKKCNFWDFQ